MKKCPYCAEEIQNEAIVCKHCGRDLESRPNNDGVLYELSTGMITYKLYSNRLDEIRLGTKQTIFIRNITNIDISLFGGMSIHTSDGKKHKMNVLGKDAKTLRDELLKLM